MHSKLLILTMILLYLKVQSLSSDISPEALIDEAHELLNTLKLYSKSLQMGTLESVQFYLDDTVHSYDNYLRTARENLITSNKQLLNKLDEIKSNYTDVDISQCLQGREEALEIGLRNQIESDLLLCFEGLTDTTINFMAEMAGNIQDVTNVVETIEIELGNCNNDDCILKVIGEIGNINMELPRNFLEIPSEVVMYQGSWMMILQGCDTFQSSRMLILGQVILDEILECIKLL